MDDLNIAIHGVKEGISLLSEAIGLVKKTKDILPDGQDKLAIEKSLEQADRASRLAESQVAMALGYELCQCTFPPQIMLSAGYKNRAVVYEEEFVCPRCNKSSIAPVVL